MFFFFFLKDIELGGYGREDAEKSWERGGCDEDMYKILKELKNFWYTLG